MLLCCLLSLAGIGSPSLDGVHTDLSHIGDTTSFLALRALPICILQLLILQFACRLSTTLPMAKQTWTELTS